MNIAVTGARGQLGMAFEKFIKHQNVRFRLFGKDDWNICSQQDSNKWLQEHGFDVLINCAAYTDVEKAESDSSNCYSINADGPKVLAEGCARTNTTLVHFSTDFVFDGTKGLPYLEDDVPNPINVYGASKLLGEKHIQDASCNHFIFRISWLFGGKEAGFLTKVNQWMKRTHSLKITADEISSPTYCHHVPEAVFSVLHHAKPSMIFHLCNKGSCSRFDWVKFYVEKCLQAPVCIQATGSDAFQTQAKRPHNSSLNNEKISRVLPTPLPTWQEATKAYQSQVDLA